MVNVVSTLQIDMLVWLHTAQNIPMWNLELSLNVYFLCVEIKFCLMGLRNFCDLSVCD